VFHRKLKAHLFQVFLSWHLLVRSLFYGYLTYLIMALQFSHLSYSKIFNAMYCFVWWPPLRSVLLALLAGFTNEWLGEQIIAHAQWLIQTSFGGYLKSLEKL
jgi:hypothetical protein